jgi:hypothetical protein
MSDDQKPFVIDPNKLDREALQELANKGPGSMIQYVETAGWQPIETAPKDGTRFLAATALASGELRIDIVHWPQSRIWDLWDESERPLDARWCVDINSINSDPLWRDVVAWMPLPNPPKE